MTDWTIITRSLTARLFSTVTTVITVAVAVALLLTLLTMRDAGRRAFDRGSGNMHLLVSRDASPLVSVLNGVFYAGSPRRPIEWSKYEQLARSAPFEFAVPTQIGDNYRGNPVLGTTPEFFTRFQPVDKRPWAFAQGRAFDKDWEVVLGAQAARATGLRLGDKISLTHGAAAAGDGRAGPAPHEHQQFKYEVVGILEPTGSAHDRALFTSLQSAWIIHAHDRREREEMAEAGRAGERPAGHEHETAEEHAAHADTHDHEHEARTTAADLVEGDRLITGIYLRLIARAGSDAPANLPQVFDQLRRDTSITVAQPQQEIGKLFGIVSSVDKILLGMAVVVMISSGIAIMLALYNSMEQRRRQIAVLRVLGASRARVFNLVITESAVIGFLGAIAGVAIAAGGLVVVARVMKRSVGLVIDAGLAPDVAMIVMSLTIVLASLAGIIPAAMAYRTAVAKNLKPMG
ncbi:MAG: ABC transporter permease [Phycisphaerales bacterium]|nr:ABC transporter permease [Phycisphaerales bacterium]